MTGMRYPSLDRGALEAEIARVRSLGLDELRSLWRATFRASPPPAFTKDLVARFLCWHVQEQAMGGLDAKMAKHVDGFSRGGKSKGDERRRLRPGAALIREYQGELHTVTVVQDGYLWREATYASLSIIARAITGTSWSGPRFFGLRKRRDPTAPVEADESQVARNGRTLGPEAGLQSPPTVATRRRRGGPRSTTSAADNGERKP